MTLRSIQFEKAVQARIEAALDADPQLRQQYGKAPKSQWFERTAARVLGRLFWSWLLAGVVGLVFRSGCPLATQSAVGAIWFAVAALMFRFRILGIFFDVPRLAALALLPTPKDLIFRWQRGRILREIWRPFADALAMLIIIAVLNGTDTGAWLVILPLALLIAVAIWAVSLWLMFVPIPRHTVYLPFLLGFLVVVIVQIETWGRWFFRLFVEYSEIISLLSPGGWGARAYLAMLSGDTMVFVALVGLTSLVAASLAFGLNRCERTYDPEGIALWYAFAEPPEKWKSIVNAQLERLHTESELGDVTKSIDSHDFLESSWADKAMGWVERWVLRVLTPRERAVLEFACFKPPDWTRQIKWAVIALAVGIGICWFAKQAGDATLGKIELLVGGAAILIGCVFSLPISSPFERAFCLVVTYGVSIPFMAVFPVTPRELTAIALKAGVIRALVFAPAMMLGGEILVHIFGFKSVTGSLLALDCAVLSVLAIPWLQMLAVSGGTSDNVCFSFKALVALMVILAGLLGLVAGGLTAIFAPLPWSVLGFVLAATSSFGSAKLYFAMYSRMWFDLARRVNG